MLKKLGKILATIIIVAVVGIIGLIVVLVLLYKNAQRKITTLPESTAQVQLVIADPKLKDTFYNIVAPTFKIDDAYSVFYDPTTDTTILLHIPDLKKHIFENFKGIVFITGRGEILLADYERNKLILISEGQSQPQILRYSDDLFTSGLDYFFLDPKTFILDGKLFKIEEGVVREAADVNYYEQKLSTGLKMIDSSRSGAESYKNDTAITCADILGENALEDTRAEVYLTENEAECLTAAFTKVYWDSQRGFLLFIDSNQPNLSESYLVIYEDLNRKNKELLKKTIRDKLTYSDFKFLDIIDHRWVDYFYSFPLRKYNFGIEVTSLMDLSFLDDAPGIYPRLEAVTFPEGQTPTNDSKFLKVSPDKSIRGERFCNRPAFIECHGVADTFTFSTPTKETKLYREDAVLIGVTLNEAFFITEKGLEKVTF